MAKEKKQQQTGSPDGNFLTLGNKLQKIKALVSSKSYFEAVSFVRLLFEEPRSHLITNLTEEAKKTAYPQLGDLIKELYEKQPALFSPNEMEKFYQKINYLPKPEPVPELPKIEPPKPAPQETLEKKVEVQLPQKTEAVKPQPAENRRLLEECLDFIARQKFSDNVLGIKVEKSINNEILNLRISGDSLYRYARFFNSNMDDAGLVSQRLWDLLKQTFNLHTFRYVGGSSNYFPLEIDEKNFEAFKTALPSFYQTLQGLHQHFGRHAKPQLSPNQKKHLLYEICLYLDMHTPEAKQPTPVPVKEPPKPEPKPEPPKPKELDLHDYDSHLQQRGFQPNQDTYVRKELYFPLRLMFDHQRKVIKIPSTDFSLLDSHFSDEQKKDFAPKFRAFLQSNFQPFNPKEEYDKTNGSFNLALKVTKENFDQLAPALDNFLGKADMLYTYLHLYLSPGLADPIPKDKFQKALEKFS